MLRSSRFCLVYIDKVVSASEALVGLQNGMSVAFGGFGCSGMPHALIKEIQCKGTKDINAYSDAAGVDDYGLGLLVQQKQLRKLTLSYVGNNKILAKQYLKGGIEIEFCPQGTLAERMRAGGAGIPAFFTATGFGTQRQIGGQILRYNPDGTPASLSPPRETRNFDGRWYVLENAIKTDFSFVKAWKADRCGNLVFRGLARNFNDVCAMCGKTVVVEVEELVDNGAIDPAEVHLPSVYVDRIVHTGPYPIHIEHHTTSHAGHTPSAENATTPEEAARQIIARRAALEFHHGMYVNLGIGIPTEAANYIPKGISVKLQSENGLLGMGPFPTEDQVSPDWINAGKQTITALPGSAIFDSSMSFAMIRGGHMDVTMLGALEVAANGDLSNWMIPGKLIKGPGGAMDLVASGSHVIVTTTHTSKKGEPKIVQTCSLPITGKSCVNRIITEKAVFDVNANGVAGLTLVEMAEGVTVDELKACTGAPFKVCEVKTMPLAPLE